MEKTRDFTPDEHQPTETERQQRAAARASASHAALQTHLQHHQDRRQFQATLPEYQMVSRYHERLLHRSHERRQQVVAGLQETSSRASGSLAARLQADGFRERFVGVSPQPVGFSRILHRLLQAFRGAKYACKVASSSVD